MNPARLTPAQARAARQLNRDLLALSRERRAFYASVRRMGWPAAHVPELWAAHMGRRFPHLAERISL